VANVKIVSDKVPDVSSLDAWKKSYIKEGMSDKEKAMAVWKTGLWRLLPARFGGASGGRTTESSPGG